MKDPELFANIAQEELLRAKVDENKRRNEHDRARDEENQIVRKLATLRDKERNKTPLLLMLRKANRKLVSADHLVNKAAQDVAAAQQRVDHLRDPRTIARFGATSRLRLLGTLLSGCHFLSTVLCGLAFLAFGRSYLGILAGLACMALYLVRAGGTPKMELDSDFDERQLTLCFRRCRQYCALAVAEVALGFSCLLASILVTYGKMPSEVWITVGSGTPAGLAVAAYLSCREFRSSYRSWLASEVMET